MGEKRNGQNGGEEAPDATTRDALLRGTGDAILRHRTGKGDELDAIIANDLTQEESPFQPDREKMEGKHSDDL